MLTILYQIGMQEYRKTIWSVFVPKPSASAIMAKGIRKLRNEIDRIAWSDVEKFVSALQQFMETEAENKEIEKKDESKKSG